MTRKPRVRTELKKQARKLFYVQGYPSTGISQIIDAAGTNKATFYYNYKSKEQLGQEYLTEYSSYLLNRLVRMMKHSRTPAEFVHRWVRLVKKDISLHEASFNGCPIGNFISQVDVRDDAFAPVLGELVTEWEDRLADFLSDMQREKSLATNVDIREAAARMLSIYHGSMLMWKATRDMRYIERSEQSMLACLNHIEV
jgi:AcrR family transcriptional regulator